MISLIEGFPLIPPPTRIVASLHLPGGEVLRN
jgi:hypothetical protein